MKINDAKQSATDAVKNGLKKSNLETEKTTDYLIGNKIFPKKFTTK